MSIHVDTCGRSVPGNENGGYESGSKCFRKIMGWQGTEHPEFHNHGKVLDEIEEKAIHNG